MDIFPFFPAFYEEFFFPQNPSHCQDGPIDFSSRPPAWFSYFWSHLMHLLLTGTNRTLAGGVCGERKEGSAVLDVDRSRQKLQALFFGGLKFFCQLLLVKHIVFQLQLSKANSQFIIKLKIRLEKEKMAGKLRMGDFWPVKQRPENSDQFQQVGSCQFYFFCCCLFCLIVIFKQAYKKERIITTIR